MLKESPKNSTSGNEYIEYDLESDVWKGVCLTIINFINYAIHLFPIFGSSSSACSIHSISWIFGSFDLFSFLSQNFHSVLSSLS